MECINGQKHLHKIQHGLLPGGEAGCHVKPERVEVDDNYLDNWPVSRDLLIRRSAFHLPPEAVYPFDGFPVYRGFSHPTVL